MWEQNLNVHFQGYQHWRDGKRENRGIWAWNWGIQAWDLFINFRYNLCVFGMPIPLHIYRYCTSLFILISKLWYQDLYGEPPKMKVCRLFYTYFSKLFSTINYGRHCISQNVDLSSQLFNFMVNIIQYKNDY